MYNKFCAPLNTIIRQYARQAKNAGMRRHLQNFDDISDVIEDPEGFGDIESDLFDSHQLHKDYENEKSEHRQKIQHHIVGRKYFADLKAPNFLTWAEKEQIRILDSQAPDEWNEEKLSESFPALPETIKKILKNHWQPESEERIRRHDSKVLENWKSFKTGKFSAEVLPRKVVEHLRKFAERKMEDIKNLKTDCQLRPELPKPESNEFSNILSSCKKLQAAGKENKLVKGSISSDFKVGREVFLSKTNPFKQITDKNYPTDEDLPNLQRLMKNKKLMQISDIKPSKICNNGGYKDVPVFHQINSSSATGIIVNSGNEQNNIYDIQKNASKGTPIKMQVKIPKKAYKCGATYKFNDCYYHSDGEFLYRVPGMTSLHKVQPSRSNTALQVCLHRGAAVGLSDHLIATENNISYSVGQPGYQDAV